MEERRLSGRAVGQESAKVACLCQREGSPVVQRVCCGCGMCCCARQRGESHESKCGCTEERVAEAAGGAKESPCGGKLSPRYILPSTSHASRALRWIRLSFLPSIHNPPSSARITLLCILAREYIVGGAQYPHRTYLWPRQRPHLAPIATRSSCVQVARGAMYPSMTAVVMTLMGTFASLACHAGASSAYTGSELVVPGAHIIRPTSTNARCPRPLPNPGLGSSR
ncbi:uncharacterized protein C8Q71DRAFT_507626 [Rhodofomes roseus]|uniref:Uncharacterized protein n=1 Tax=Rhodofomes roseus TaxID=34475 RepID=A0ABQ8KN85_9APHY|nr:uncharacterized protein C8Q71DRAFT_507626 [Rhodofomes roseus]KAH9839345.1 hypothetical protein C8Q71DRAFT_507626 [Rhodofomes roseus]